MSQLPGPPVSADDLLHDIEPLPYPRRCHHLALTGRALAGRAGLAEVLESLARRGQYERFVALALSEAAGESDFVTGALRDPDPDVAVHAVGVADRRGLPDEVFEALLDDAPVVVRTAVYRAVRRGGREPLAERLLDAVRRRWGDGEAGRLLPSCGTGVAAARIDELAHAVANWPALGRRHPGIVLDHAERALAGLPPNQWPEWWRRHDGGVAAATPYDPQRVITLLERHWTAGPMPPAMVKRCGLLLDADAPRMLELLLTPDRGPAVGHWLGRRAVRRRLAGLPDAELGRVGRAAREREQLLLALLAAVAPSRRAVLFDAAMTGVDRERAWLSDQILEVLPAARRAAEARRMLGLRPIRDDPDRVIAVTAFLPYDEAEPALAARTRARDADERADGYRLPIACAGRSRDPEILTRLLESLTRLRNEQDPVRDRAAAALAAVPPGLFHEVHLPALDQLIDDALAARDCSSQTRYTLTRMATRVFEQGVRAGCVAG
jgi:hypothetical protein